jgi:hypothetical protein
MIVHHAILGSVKVEVQSVERFDEGTLVDSYKQNFGYLALIATLTAFGIRVVLRMRLVTLTVPSAPALAAIPW